MHLNEITLHTEKYPTFEHYPFNLDIFRNTRYMSFSTPVTFFIGENGTGKSTLLKAICLKCGIHIWEDTERSRYKYNHYEADLYKYLTVKWAAKSVPGSFFGSQVFHDFARFLDEWARATPAILDYFGGSSLLTQSHGQSLSAFFESIYKVKGLHFLDEPETALSPGSQLNLLKILSKMSKAGHAQFIIATHSPILLAYPEATIYSFDNSIIKAVDYEKTDYYKIYHDFMNNRQKYLFEL